MIVPPHQLSLNILSLSSSTFDLWRILLFYLRSHITCIKWWQLFLRKTQTALSEMDYNLGNKKLFELIRNKYLHPRMQKLSSKWQELKQFVYFLILLFLQPSCETLSWAKIPDNSKRKQNTCVACWFFPHI